VSAGVAIAWLVIGFMALCALLVAVATIVRKVQERRSHQDQTRRNLEQQTRRNLRRR
jgi:flagellar biogenesis protein FliO